MREEKGVSYDIPSLLREDRWRREKRPFNLRSMRDDIRDATLIDAELSQYQVAQAVFLENNRGEQVCRLDIFGICRPSNIAGDSKDISSVAAEFL